MRSYFLLIYIFYPLTFFLDCEIDAPIVEQYFALLFGLVIQSPSQECIFLEAFGAKENLDRFDSLAKQPPFEVVSKKNIRTEIFRMKDCNYVDMFRSSKQMRELEDFYFTNFPELSVSKENSGRDIVRLEGEEEKIIAALKGSEQFVKKFEENLVEREIKVGSTRGYQILRDFIEIERLNVKLRFVIRLLVSLLPFLMIIIFSSVWKEQTKRENISKVRLVLCTFR